MRWTFLADPTESKKKKTFRNWNVENRRRRQRKQCRNRKQFTKMSKNGNKNYSWVISWQQHGAKQSRNRKFVRRNEKHLPQTIFVISLFSFVWSLSVSIADLLAAANAWLCRVRLHFDQMKIWIHDGIFGAHFLISDKVLKQSVCVFVRLFLVLRKCARNKKPQLYLWNCVRMRFIARLLNFYHMLNAKRGSKRSCFNVFESAKVRRRVSIKFTKKTQS